MGMGLMPVINRVTDLPLHFEEGKHYLGFSSEDDAVAKVMAALQRDEFSFSEMEKEAHELVKKYHTFKHRVKQIMETVWK
jgi:spore maturation protein CgeB